MNWSQILESLLFWAFCFCSRKRSPAALASLRSKLAHYQCEQRSTISSAGKMVSEPGSHYFETLLLQFGNLADAETERREGIMLHKSGGCFLRLPEETGEQGAPKAELVVVAVRRNCSACFLHLPTWSREPPATLPEDISVSQGEAPLVVKEDPLLQFWGTWVARTCLVVQ